MVAIGCMTGPMSRPKPPKAVADQASLYMGLGMRHRLTHGLDGFKKSHRNGSTSQPESGLDSTYNVEEPHYATCWFGRAPRQVAVYTGTLERQLVSSILIFS